MKTDEVTHVVADDSDDPEHVDDCPGCESATGAIGFYVTVRSGSRSGALLGPYGTHDEALANVDRARRYALKHCGPDASFAGYGTARVTAKPGRKLRPGSFNDRICLTAEEGTEER